MIRLKHWVDQIIVVIGQPLVSRMTRAYVDFFFLFSFCYCFSVLGDHSRKHIADYLQIHLHMPSISIHTENGLHLI